MFLEVVMNGKTGFAGLAAVLFAVLTPISGFCQNIGFQIGLAPPQIALPAVQAPVIAVRNPFTPIQPIGLPSTPFISATPSVPLVPNFPTVIVPNTVLVPGQIFIPQTVFPVIPQPLIPAVGPRPVILPPTNGYQPIVTGTVQAVRPLFPPVGTPRGEVLRLLGQPSVTVITSTGETLYFTGGVTVIIQNGQVIGPR
jgi:hypothetical protein